MGSIDGPGQTLLKANLWPLQCGLSYSTLGIIEGAVGPRLDGRALRQQLRGEGYYQVTNIPSYQFAKNTKLLSYQVTKSPCFQATKLPFV